MLIFILLMGLVLRIYKLGAHNLWYDEVASVMFSDSLSSLKNIFLDYHPPLYYILLHIWRSIFGSSEFALRALSMSFGLLTLPLIYKLGRLLFNSRVGLASAFILAISPLQIWYAQEVRGNTLATFLTVLIVYLLYQALNKDKFIYWFGLLITLLIGIYINYFILLIPAVATVLFFQTSYRDKFKKWLMVCLALITGFSFWLPVLVKQLVFISFDSWISKPKPISIMITLKNFYAGFNASGNIFSIMFILGSILLLIGLLYRLKEKKREVIFLAYFIFMPIFIIYLISQIKPIYLSRQLMLFSPFCYLAIASGLEKIKQPIIRLSLYMAIILLTSICLFNYFSYRMPSPYIYHEGVFVKKPVKAAADYLKSNLKADDLVCSSSIYSRRMQYYLLPEIPGKKIPHLIIDSGSGRLSLTTRLAYKYGKLMAALRPIIQVGNRVTIPGAKLLDEYNFQRLWLISPAWSKNDSFNEPGVQEIRSWLRSRYLLMEHRDFDGIVVELFCKKLS